MPSTVTYRTLDLAGLDVPFIEITGSTDGPLLTVLAGVHGCEYASMAAVRRWTRGLAERDLRGRVRAVPVLNLPAFRSRTPFVVPEDGKNLNRCLPGDRAGVRCAGAGWWEPSVQTGQTVTQGQVLGTISTLDGASVLETISAPVAGVPMFVTSSPAVAADGLLLGLAAV